MSTTCTSACTSSCGTGCASSATSMPAHNMSKISNNYMLDIVQDIARYIILLGNKNDIITSANSIFNITVEPLNYAANITFDNGVTENNGVYNLHRYENVFKINRVNNDIELTKKEYRQVYDVYTEPTVITVGNRQIECDAGSRIVKTYALYTDTEIVNVSYMQDGVHQTISIVHEIGNPVEKYFYYEDTEYDENHNVLHYAGDVMLDDNGEILCDYAVIEYMYHWDLIDEQSYTRPNVYDNPDREWIHV